MFQRILIANRGEIAVRIIRACRELGMSPLAVYSTVDAQALHVRLADAAICIGPAPAVESYLRPEAIVAAARALGAEAVHPGYGFLAEHAEFAQLCADAGLVFVGPPPAAMRIMGGKIGARQLAQSVGVAVVPGYDGEDQREARLLSEAERVGFPLLIKASAGGGGKGMRAVYQRQEFSLALAGAQREALGAFGDPTVLLERLLIRPRHVEIQILADAHGNILHLGERECSIQRRHQKIIEEAPSPALTPLLRHQMGEAAVRIARAAGYVNAGTIEFILDAAGAFYFLEMNTRLQVEHPVTELVSGLDLVRWQIAIAAGERLPWRQEELLLRGHAIEARLYAEDPVSYLPAIGRLALLELPSGPGVRIDAGVVRGDEITVHYDPLIAKLIVFGESRQAAVARMGRVLDEVALLGLTTNLPLLRAVVAHPVYAAGDTHTGFLGDHSLIETGSPEVPPEVLAAAALWELDRESMSSDPFATHWRLAGNGMSVRLMSDGREHHLLAYRYDAQWEVTVADVTARVSLMRRESGELILELGSSTVRLWLARAADGAILVAWQGSTYRLTHGVALSVDSAVRVRTSHGAANLVAPMPGTVVRLLVSEGEQVHEGQALMVLEAMKMEHTVVAPYAGIVRCLAYHQGAGVTSGARLAEIDPLDSLPGPGAIA